MVCHYQAYSCLQHDDVIKWKHFPRYWSFVRGIHRWPVNSLRKGQWHRALMFSFNCTPINGWVNNREAGDLRHHHAHYDVTVMKNRHTSFKFSLVTEDFEYCYHWSDNISQMAEEMSEIPGPWINVNPIYPDVRIHCTLIIKIRQCLDCFTLIIRMHICVR